MKEDLLLNETTGKILTKETCCPSLSFKERLIGFLMCFCIGFIISIVSFFRLLSVITNPMKFTVTFSMGNICSICSTLFLFGPQAQFKRMMKPTRMICSIVLILSIIGSIIFSFYYKKSILWHKILLYSLLGTQCFTMFWYTLSYIPYARTLCKKLCSCCLKTISDSDNKA